MSDFEIIKQKIDLRDFICTFTQTQVKKRFADYVILETCPFCGGHDCFSVHEKFYKCFQCDTGKGDVFICIEKISNVSRFEALKQAAEYAGIELTVQEEKREKSSSKKKDVFTVTAEYYHQHITLNGGYSYIKEKRQHTDNTINRLKIGYTDGRLASYLLAQGFTEQEVIESGLVRKEAKLYDFFKPGLVVFPHFYNKSILHFTIKDPKGTLKYQLPANYRKSDWKFYNQDALNAYSELIIVEGENDVASVIDAGFNNVIGFIGTPSDVQLDALQDCKKKLCFWLDNDDAGKQTTRKICKTLPFPVKIIIYPKLYKDPDAYLKSFAVNQQSKICREVLTEAIDYVLWELQNAKEFENLDDRIKILRDEKVFNKIAICSDDVIRDIYISELHVLGLSTKAIKQELDLSRELKKELDTYFAMLQNKREADAIYVANIIYSFFEQFGRFFYDSSGVVTLLYNHHLFEVGQNRSFNALMKKMTELLPTTGFGRSVWEALASDGYNHGIMVQQNAWIYTDKLTNVIYTSLNLEDNFILKIEPSVVTKIKNGINSANILLKASNKIQSFTYKDTDLKQAFELLDSLIISNLTCERENQFFVLCWMISMFMIDFSPYSALVKFSGGTASGKTTAAKLISLLFYGDEHLSTTSTAAAYAVSSQNPLIILDNLESEDITRSLLNFLLLSATGGAKEKRKSGTDSDTVEERLKALVLVTAIEPFTKPELINRTVDIEFNKKNRKVDFLETEAIGGIISHRNTILSTLIQFISAEILPNLNERRQYITILKTEYKGHSKDRTDEYFSLLFLILSKVLKYFNYEIEEKNIRKAWIEYQNAQAKDSEVTSNTILKLLDGLMREYLLAMKDLQPELIAGYTDKMVSYQSAEYHLEIVRSVPRVYEDQNGEPYTITMCDFIATSGELVSAFDKYCRNYGIKNPYSNPHIFGKRLINDMATLKQGGWQLLNSEKTKPYFRILNGQRYWKFRKTLLR
jgi:DNA primase